MTFDIDHVVQNATNVEKWELLSGQSYSPSSDNS
jgi:hypothetical protein